ncbi:pro-sigmaK processing inhibitor BofA family protein [Thermosediminibacter litoriperuensis]|uniref:Inhibitor of the pro-sigma K processing machinery n=1 Tax=Thermosediminibacter litoriperuensis TaxID=291989 RepID=A0A5S5AE90_9FIRM|nr:pro-sigmaK processing inhibitor BofA family protein [Thermosediminibacter litoriperuensis]TYP47680.1 inhibitor of the pro-sigma K processing machinery [Thermosediminibacter litoriperuensis]
MQLDIGAIAAYAFGLIMLYVIGRVLLGPIKFVLQLIYNAVIGGIILLLLNFIGGYVGLHIAVNPLTALTVGFLGVPGIILLIILKNIL